MSHIDYFKENISQQRVDHFSWLLIWSIDYVTSELNNKISSCIQRLDTYINTNVFFVLFEGDWRMRHAKRVRIWIFTNTIAILFAFFCSKLMCFVVYSTRSSNIRNIFDIITCVSSSSSYWPEFIRDTIVRAFLWFNRPQCFIPDTFYNQLIMK